MGINIASLMNLGNRRCFLAGVIVVAAMFVNRPSGCVWATDPPGDDLPTVAVVSAPIKQSIDALVVQIRGGNFFERERATTELFAMGPSIVEPLMQRMDRESDRETLLRLSDVAVRLQRQNDAAMENRFLSGLNDQLEGWRWFSALLGDNSVSRQAFVDLRRTYPGRAKMLDGTSRDRGTVLRESVTELQRRMFNGRLSLGPTDLLCVLLPLADPAVPVGPKVDQIVLTLVRGRTYQSLLTQPGTRNGITDLLNRWISRSDPTSVDQALAVGRMLQLPAGDTLARRVLSDNEPVQERQRQPLRIGPGAMMPPVGPVSVFTVRTALQMMAVGGRSTDVSLISKWLPDVRDAAGQTNRGGQLHSTNIGDCAAATIVCILDLDPNSIGMSPLGFDEKYGFAPDAVGFPVEKPERREKSREKLRQKLSPPEP